MMEQRPETRLLVISIVGVRAARGANGLGREDPMELLTRLLRFLNALNRDIGVCIVAN